MHRYLAWGASIHMLTRIQTLPFEAEAVFRFFQDPYNLKRITPPDMRFEVLSCEPDPIVEGSTIRYHMRTFGVTHGWTTRIAAWNPPHRFIDIQERGPYVLWEHTHTFDTTDGSVVMRDRVRYQVPFGPIGELMHCWLIRPRLDRIFDYRARSVPVLLEGYR